MLRSRRTNALVILLLLLLATMLGVLATLQYRWIDRISEAERQQMRANIDFASRRFADDLTHELEPVVRTFEAHDDIVAQHRDLVRAAYEVVREDDGFMLDDGRNLVPFPPELDGLRRRFETIFRERQRGVDPPPPGPFLADIPALLLIERRQPAMFDDGPPHPRIVLILLDRESLRTTLFPRLAQQHFGKDFDVAIVVHDAQKSDVLYRSHTTWPDGRTPPDALVILEPVTRRGPERGVAGQIRARMPAPSRRADGARWELLVRRHDGSVDAIVANARRRNLAVSFGIVLILGAAMILLAALLRRAERLRQQQIEFVAAISHELNTPVAALRSAGENLRDGIIHDHKKVARYGESIVRESTRLGELTSQVLELAGMRERRERPRQSFDVATIVDDAIAQCSWLLQGTNVRIEQHVDRDLPQLTGDAGAITRALQNLIANAIRHGGGEWVGVTARREGDRVNITVEDRGPGVDPSEAGQLFDAFYRGRKSSAVPGAGLGLAIVKQIALAHGGAVRLDKKRDGASFTLELPVADHA